MLCSAATDPYTQCGFTKVLCVSHIEEFCLHHLPDIYLGRIGIDRREIDRQIAKLIEIEGSEEVCSTLVETSATLDGIVLDKLYFDELQTAVLELIQPDAKRVLSVGCERGLTEGELVKRGHQLTAVPVDCVIAESARMRGVKTTSPDLEAAVNELEGQRFEVVWFNNLLSYVTDPVALLRAYRRFLSDDGVILVSFSNHRCAQMLKRKIRQDAVSCLSSPGTPFDESGIHRTDAHVVRSWLKRAGLLPNLTRYEIDDPHKRLSKLSLGMANWVLGRRGIVRAVGSN
jgi:2-polyprenyl-3-methyl-5-hydroxy-6-metoxy-1,4-benzoquinol methylase